MLRKREILKTPNSGLILAIANEIKRTTTQPELLKVKAHIGLTLNERADRNAKAITEDK
jgi:ribonuclease HI